MTINFKDYISEEERKEICLEIFKDAIKKETKKDIERILSNTAYCFIYDEVDKIIGKDSRELLRKNVLKVIADLNNFCVFRRKDAWEHEDSVAYLYMQQVISESKPLIKKQLEKALSNIDWDIFRVSMEEKVSEMIFEKLTKPGGPK